MILSPDFYNLPFIAGFPLPYTLLLFHLEKSFQHFFQGKFSNDEFCFCLSEMLFITPILMIILLGRVSWVMGFPFWDFECICCSLLVCKVSQRNQVQIYRDFLVYDNSSFASFRIPSSTFAILIMVCLREHLFGFVFLGLSSSSCFLLQTVKFFSHNFLKYIFHFLVLSSPPNHPPCPNMLSQIFPGLFSFFKICLFALLIGDVHYSIFQITDALCHLASYSLLSVCFFYFSQRILHF